MSIFRIALLGSILLGAAGPRAQTALLIPEPEVHDVVADDGAVHRLFVSLPRAYSDDAAGRFPVLYLLDANTLFAMVAQTYGYFDVFGGLESVIIVGLGYPADDWSEVLRRRTYDYTPTRHAPTEAWWREVFDLEQVRTGGAPAFLELLGRSVIPLIESTYRTSDVRALGGFSYGGLFAAYALLTDPALFHRYLLGSPSLGWDDGAVFDLAAALAEGVGGGPRRVFLSAGSAEPAAIHHLARFAAALGATSENVLAVQTYVFEDETHLSVIPATMSRGLRVLFGDGGR